ncbi:hypothetical protein DL96DRAFT_1551198 [Flagelloscypha sp. PMI_526]|nr:hypothetical protein DL96DRAFT_1551198 [Flagelloscypha sp. PMI_526]
MLAQRPWVECDALEFKYRLERERHLAKRVDRIGTAMDECIDRQVSSSSSEEVEKFCHLGSSSCSESLQRHAKLFHDRATVNMKMKDGNTNKDLELEDESGEEVCGLSVISGSYNTSGTGKIKRIIPPSLANSNTAVSTM